jgi:streptogramin lyase
VKPKDRVTIAVSGGTIYVADPLGRVVTLDAGTMRRIELLEDAASPRAIVVGSGSVYIADSESVTRLRPDTLDQQNVEPFEGAVAMASDDGAPIAVVGKVGNRGRLCLVNADSLDPCAPLPFVPTGVGADSKGNVYVADGARGTVTSYGRRAGQFVARTPLEVGKGASGNIIVRGSTLYVAVERGLAMVSGGQVAGTVQLPTTPGLIDVAETGFVFAPLPAASQVAVIDADDPLAEPQLVDVGRQPFSASAAGDLVYVADAADRSIARLDAATGESGGSTPVDALVKAPVKPIIARSLAATKNGLTTTGVLALQGGKLEASGFRLLDNDISDGTLSFELRSGGIGRGFETKALPDLGINMTLQEFPGRVVATLRASKPFTSGTAKLAPNGRSVGITLVEPAPVVPNNDNNNNNGSTGGGGGGGTPPPHTTNPPATSIDVG